MRFKKAFTLSEILIVLMIIGTLAALTVPSINRNANMMQKKAAFKKAYNSLSTAYAQEFATSPRPTTKDHTTRILDMMTNNMPVKYFMDVSTDAREAVYEKPAQNITNYMIVTEDGLAYQIVQGNANCASKLTINAISNGNVAGDNTNVTDASRNATCFGITVDADGPTKGGNTLNYDDAKADDFTDDQMQVFVATNGIATGGLNTFAGKVLESN